MTREQYPYFRTLPLYKYVEKEKETAKSYELTLLITINYELMQWFLFLGDSIKILEPKSLKQSIIEKLNSNLQQYQ